MLLILLHSADPPSNYCAAIKNNSWTTFEKETSLLDFSFPVISILSLRYSRQVSIYPGNVLIRITRSTEIVGYYVSLYVLDRQKDAVETFDPPLYAIGIDGSPWSQ